TRKAAPKAEKSRGRKKDPKAPKRALSAYMFFSQDWRERIKTENPEASFGQCFPTYPLLLPRLCNCPTGEVGKLLGAKWKELDEDEKKPYVEQAARDKERAEQEKSEYESKQNGGEEEDDE
ncbi:hypothetical protein EWM64_g9262, partial [Hericium alpestre]